MGFSSSCHHLRLRLCLVSVLVFNLWDLSTTTAAAEANDTEALAIFMHSADLHANLAANWTTPDACAGCWAGVTCSPLNGRVTSLSLPNLNLRGPLDPLSRLDQLRLLDLHGNRLNGTLLPLLPSLPHLKLLYLSGNDISGEIPREIGLLARLTRVDVSNNNLRGPIPAESALANLTHLLTLRVQNNLLSGILPDLSVSLPRLSEFNASDNLLYGRVPDGMMAKFGLASLYGNAGLCGPSPPLPLCSLTKPPPSSSSSVQSTAPSDPSSRPDTAMYHNNNNNSSSNTDLGKQRGHLGKNAVIGIVLGNVMLILVLLIFLLAYCFCCGVQISDKADVEQQDVDDDVVIPAGINTGHSYSAEKAGKNVNKRRRRGNKRINSGSSGGGERVEDEDRAEDASQSKLVFFQENSYSSDSNASSNGSGGAARITENGHSRVERRRRGRGMRFGLEELLRASAEMLGKGSLGTVYRAVLEDGSMVAVKRLKDANPCNRNDFHRYMDIIGRLTHPNIVPLKAYYYAPQEKLLIYDYLPNGTLYSLLHGNRGAGRVPVDWTTRVSLMLGAARGLAHIHQAYNSSKIPHGNIKSSNVLIDKNGIACISDFGLALLLNPVHTIARLGGYTAPEQQAVDGGGGERVLSQEADVYGFGVLILEVLTGRAPAQYPSPPPKKKKKKIGEECPVGGPSLPEWVKSVVKEEWTAEVFDAELMRYKNIEDEMVAMLHVGLACVDPKPERRPSMLEVVSMMEDMGVEQSPLPEEEEEEEGSRVSVPASILTTNTEDGGLSC